MKRKQYAELPELKGLIRARGTSYSEVAKTIGITTNTMSNKINGFYGFTPEEIEKICIFLEVRNEDIVKYFFPSMLSNSTI